MNDAMHDFLRDHNIHEIEYVHSDLPRNLKDTILRMRGCAPLSDVLGASFVQAFCEVKELEFATFSRVISSWEREHLMLLV